jgi:antitoxin (DNA-binding transcriptional repressor) of toxin-antitoxin stability system
LPDQSDEELGTGDTYAVERDGKVVAYLIPVKRADSDEPRKAFENLDRAIDESLQGGYSREELAKDLDLSRPFGGDK